MVFSFVSDFVSLLVSSALEDFTGFASSSVFSLRLGLALGFSFPVIDAAAALRCTCCSFAASMAAVVARVARMFSCDRPIFKAFLTVLDAAVCILLFLDLTTEVTILPFLPVTSEPGDLLLPGGTNSVFFSEVNNPDFLIGSARTRFRGTTGTSLGDLRLGGLLPLVPLAGETAFSVGFVMFSANFFAGESSGLL